jgi:hypothetical protein
MRAAGLSSRTVVGASGVRARRKVRALWAPARDALERSSREGFSSPWVNAMLKPMPPVPEVPTLT